MYLGINEHDVKESGHQAQVLHLDYGVGIMSRPRYPALCLD